MNNPYAEPPKVIPMSFIKRLKECLFCKNPDVIIRDKRTGYYVCENHIFNIQPKEAREVLEDV